MANTTYTPRFSANSEGKDMVRLYAVINYTYYHKGNSNKSVIRFAVRNQITGKSYKLKKTLWDKQNNRCYVNRGSKDEMQECRDANSMMKSIVKAVDDIVKDCALRKISVSPSMLTEDKIYEMVRKTDEILISVEPEKGQGLSDYWASYIEKAKKGEVRHNGNRYTEGTIKGYNKCLNSLLEYQEKRQHIFTFDEITMDFYTDYTLYLEERLIKNSVGEHYKKIKHIMKCARLEGLHTNMQYENFTVSEEDVDNVYLTEEELTAIANLELSGTRLDKYRDVFLIGCYTGLRVSDLLKIRNKHFYEVNGVKMLKIKTQKTQKDVYIPFLWKDLQYRLEKYDYNLPKMSEQHLRKDCREVARLAGINTPVLINSGRLKRSTPYEKWETISIHTCRRTACTNMFKKGIPTKQIMMISGHTKESSFLKYIKITEEENAIMLAKQFGLS